MRNVDGMQKHDYINIHSQTTNRSPKVHIISLNEIYRFDMVSMLRVYSEILNIDIIILLIVIKLEY